MRNKDGLTFTHSARLETHLPTWPEAYITQQVSISLNTGSVHSDQLASQVSTSPLTAQLYLLF